MTSTDIPDGSSAAFRRASDALWEALHEHAFVRGLGDGTLGRERFKAYLAEDYAYLIEYARAMALGAGIATDLEGQRFFTEQAHNTLNVEMDLHRRVAEACGLTEADLLAVEPHPTAVAYGAHLVGAARSGEEAQLVAALLPCAAGYVELADRLARRQLPEVPAYRDWIETYTSDGMRDLAAWLTARFDQAAARADETTRARWWRTYRRSVEFEGAFFSLFFAEP